MYALGIKPFGHDTSASLIRDNKIIAASAQERFDRITHSSAFPSDAIKFCLEFASIKINQVDEIAISYNYEEAIMKLFFLRTLKYLPKSLVYIKDFTKILNTKIKVINRLRIDLGYNGKILYLDHHDCHAASAYYCSPFNKTAIITLDGRGEWTTNRIYTAENGFLKRFDQMNYPHSMGMVYENVTNYLGFHRNSDEGKVMGLSSYGEPKYYTNFKKIIENKGDWKYNLDLSFFNHHLREKSLLPEKFIEIFGKAREKDEEINTRHKNIAASLQKITNEVVLKMAKKAGLDCSLNSNLTTITRKDAGALKEAGLDFTLTSLHSFEEKTHDTVTQRKGSFKRTLRGIKICQDAGLDVGANMVVMKINQEQVIETGKFARNAQEMHAA